MKGFKLRKGDLITAANNTAVITKVTRGYLYYYLDGRVARVRKAAVWEAHDCRKDVLIHYGTRLNRRKQRKMQSTQRRRKRSQRQRGMMQKKLQTR